MAEKSPQWSLADEENFMPLNYSMKSAPTNPSPATSANTNCEREVDARRRNAALRYNAALHCKDNPEERKRKKKNEHSFDGESNENNAPTAIFDVLAEHARADIKYLPPKVHKEKREAPETYLQNEFSRVKKTQQNSPFADKMNFSDVGGTPRPSSNMYQFPNPTQFTVAPPPFSYGYGGEFNSLLSTGPPPDMLKYHGTSPSAYNMQDLSTHNKFIQKIPCISDVPSFLDPDAIVNGATDATARTPTAREEFEKRSSSEGQSKNSSNSDDCGNIQLGDMYKERRKKNNEAAKRSRDARRAKEDQAETRLNYLFYENYQLRTEFAYWINERDRALALAKP